MNWFPVRCFFFCLFLFVSKSTFLRSVRNVCSCDNKSRSPVQGWCCCYQPHFCAIVHKKKQKNQTFKKNEISWPQLLRIVQVIRRLPNAQTLFLGGFRLQILERVGVDYVVQNMPAMHRDHQCLSHGSAQLLYIREASSGHTHYGLHLYRLRSSKKVASSTPMCSIRRNPVFPLEFRNIPNHGRCEHSLRPSCRTQIDLTDWPTHWSRVFQS